MQRLETEARELQQCYDEVTGIVRTVALTQRLVKLQEAKALKEKVDATKNKEVVLKARLKPWLEKAYLIMASIKGKLATLQETQQKLQANSAGPVAE